MVNFGFSGQFESKSQRYSDSRRIGANAACGLFVNFWGFNVSLSLSKGLGNVIRLRYFGKLNMTGFIGRDVSTALRPAQHDRL